VRSAKKQEAARDYAPIQAGDIGCCPAEALEIGCIPFEALEIIGGARQ
jgi:hypothetical protein